jgi:hypothetical protein
LFYVYSQERIKRYRRKQKILGHQDEGCTYHVPKELFPNRLHGSYDLIKNSLLFYHSWKYWHSPMLHGKALGLVVAYDMELLDF